MHPKCTFLHLNKKKPHICKYCNKSFTRTTGLTKHLNICKIKKENDILTIKQNEEIIKMQEKINSLENQINDKNIINNKEL